MSFPVDFPDSPLGYSFGLTAYGNRHAAFEYGGNLFAFVTQFSIPYDISLQPPEEDWRCHAMMSSDAGATWVEQDSSNAPGLRANGNIPDFVNDGGPGSTTGVKGPQYSVAVDGSTALIFSVQLASYAGAGTPTSVSRNQLIKFNLLTLAWDNSYITPTRVVDIQRNHTAPATSGVGTTYAQLIVLGVNDYVLYFSTLSEVVGGTFAYARMAYARFDGTTMGAVVDLPDQSGIAFSFWPADAVLDENGLIHFFYQKSTFFDPSTTYHVSLDTSAWTFGTTQTILTAQSYWQDEYNALTSTISKAIVYTPSGGSQQVAICLEVMDPTLSFQTLSFYYADVAVDPAWQQVDISSGTDLTTTVSGTSTIILFPIPQIAGGAGSGSISISEQSGSIVVAWNNAMGNPPSRLGSVIYSTANSATLVFTAPAVLFASGPISSGLGSTPVIGVDTFLMTSGIGILANSTDQPDTGAEIMQFYFIPLGTCQIVVSGAITELMVACPVAGGTATTGVPYNSGAPPVSGGTPPYFFTLASGTLPTGFTLDPFTGIISGTTEQEGIFSHTLEVQDSSSPVQFAEVPDPCTIVVSINQGCRFRLLKLMPTFGPAKKLPVRGSVE